MDHKMNGSNGRAHAAKRRKTSTGTMPNDPICLLDSSDDEATDSEGCVILLDTDDTQDLDRKPAVKKATSLGKAASTAAAENKTIEGCMMNPKHPIKLFATDQDKATRKSLRRELATKQENSSNQDQNSNHWSNFHCWTFREMLGFDRFSGLRHEPPPSPSSKIVVKDTVGIDFIFITTYLLDIDFLLTEIPELVTIPIVVVVYQYMHESLSGRQERWVQQASSLGHSLTFLVRDPRARPKSATNPLKHFMEYGCQHTKMTLVGYSSGRLRVNIHTSNLGYGDVHHKTQAAFIQDFFPKTEDQMFESSSFEESLVTYMESYDYCEALPWKLQGENETIVSHLQSYDFSSAVGVLIPSIPGYHNPSIHGTQKDKVFGYKKVQLAIRDHCSSPKKSNEYPTPFGFGGSTSGNSIVCQCSSMGSLSRPYLSKIADAWNADKANVASLPPKKKRPRADKESFSILKIVWPTNWEIVSSVEGCLGGGSVPGRGRNLHKDFLRPLLHKWSSLATEKDESVQDFDKGRHVPHIKSYYQMRDNGDTNDMRWFVLSSHNLSKAAWGEVQNRQDYSVRGHTTTSEVLVIQHWELGVFVSPSTLGVDAMGAPSYSGTKYEGVSDVSATRRTVIPLPYQFHPIQYTNKDQPWVVED